MPCIVDVTYMSDEEVKRLGHCDDPVETPVRRSRYVRPAPTIIDGLLAFTAAAAAHRINTGEYVKAGSGQFVNDVWTPNPKTPNRELMNKILRGEIQVLDEDRELAEKIRTHYKGLTLKILAGKLLNEFEQKSMNLASATEVREYDLNIIASMPSGFSRAESRQSVEDRLYNCESSHLGTVGQKITVQGEVVRCVYSQQWATYYLTIITDTNHNVFFGNRRPVNVGDNIKIFGNVKAHRENNQTQLNYVKII